MALTAVITKQSVSKINLHDYMVSVSAEIVDDIEGVVLTKKYSERYYSEVSMDTVEKKIQAAIKADWDKLADEGKVQKAVAFGDMCAAIQIATNTYINK